MATSEEAYAAAKEFASYHEHMVNTMAATDPFEADDVKEYIVLGDTLLRAILSEEDREKLPELPKE